MRRRHRDSVVPFRIELANNREEFATLRVCSPANALESMHAAKNILDDVRRFGFGGRPHSALLVGDRGDDSIAVH